MAKEKKRGTEKIKKVEQPTIEQWRALYDAAALFKKAACWKWMYNTDLFAVEDPETGDMTFSCIMGELGEHLALASYTWPDGLMGVLRMFNNDVNGEDDEVLFIQDCLMCSFEDRDYLTKEDRAVIKELGLKFRGHNAWPLFRRYRPGFVPWPLTAAECRLLTVTLEQSVHVAMRCKTDKTVIATRKPNTLFARVCTHNDDGTITWNDSTTDITLPQQQFPSAEFDELRVKRLRNAAKHPQAILEIDSFYIPTHLTDGEPYYYPRVVAVLDHGQEMVLALNVVAGQADAASQMGEELCQFVETYNVRPSEVRVCRREVFQALDDLSQKLGVNLEFVSELQQMRELAWDLANNFPTF